MSSAYQFVLTGATARELVSKSASLRRRTLLLLDSLAADPFQQPDFHETSPSGRAYAVLVIDGTVITYWVDHAVKEIRVIQIEWV